MKEKKHFFIYRMWLLSSVVLATFACITVALCRSPESTGEGLFLAIAGLALSLPLPAIMPILYVIDGKGIRIYYFLGFFKEEYVWENITEINLEYSRNRSYFQIHGRSENIREGKSLWFMQGEISKTRRGRKVIELYMGKRIDGYITDDIKSGARKIRKRLNRRTTADVSRIQKMEREARKDVRNALLALYPNGGAPKATYIYVTRDGTKLGKRPNKSYNRREYSYCLLLFDKMLPLISVRITRKRHIGRIEYSAESTLTETIGELDNIGI